MTLSAENISYSVRKKSIVSACSVTVSPGVFTAVVGPNGAGKTTLLKIMACEVTRYKGQVTLNEQNIFKIRNRRLSQIRSVLPQHTTVSFPFMVEQVIQIGRYPHATTHAENDRIITEVMELTSLTDFRGRAYQTLSGGEQQRVQMARVMAQIWDDSDFPKYLLLDEPTSSLDLAQQHMLLDLAKSLCRRNIGVLAILHDLNLAAQYADEVLFMKAGHTIAQGAVADVMTTAIIEEAFAHPVRVICDELTGKPVIYPVLKNEKNDQNKTRNSLNAYAYEQFNHG